MTARRGRSRAESFRFFPPWDARRGHRLYRQDAIELSRVEEPLLEHDLANRLARLHRLLRDFRGFRIPDVRTQRGGGGGAAIEQLAAPRVISLDAVDAEHLERVHRVGENGR